MKKYITPTIKLKSLSGAALMAASIGMGNGDNPGDHYYPDDPTLAKGNGAWDAEEPTHNSVWDTEDK